MGFNFNILRFGPPGEKALPVPDYIKNVSHQKRNDSTPSYSVDGDGDLACLLVAQFQTVVNGSDALQAV
jgi:hypothetical protein